MKKVILSGIIVAIVAILAALYIWFFVYNKPHRNFEKAKPDLVLPARQCYDNFSRHKGKEGGKVIEIYGIPSGIENYDSLVVVYFSFSQGMFGSEGIRCTMLPDFQKSALRLSTRDTVYIKGFCSGYNGTDVILQSCSILHNLNIKGK